jgi:hypothetical protein
MGLKANADGSGAIQVGGSDAITITSGLNTTFVGTATVPTGTLYPLVSATAKAYNWNGLTTNTSIDFDTIPSWVKRITVIFNGVSTSGSSAVQVQIGSGSITTTGYTNIAGLFTNSSTSAVIAATSGFAEAASTITLAAVRYGSIVINNVTGNTWVASGVLGNTGNVIIELIAGAIALGGTLDRVRITTISPGTDTFDAGSINILYE